VRGSSVTIGVKFHVVQSGIKVVRVRVRGALRVVFLRVKRFLTREITSS
jgi:hypothetical protein